MPSITAAGTPALPGAPEGRAGAFGAATDAPEGCAGAFGAGGGGGASLVAGAPSPSKLRRVAGWSVHLYTATGLVCGFYALRAIVADQAEAAFRWMALALVIDGTDGMLARAVDVRRVVPEYDGAKLDDITDYLNYVFLPLYFAYRFALVPAGWDIVLVLPLLASAYGFCSSQAKTSDGYFTGFPSYWNVTVFYLYVLGVPGPYAALLIAYLSVMVFVPIRYLYPSKAPCFRKLSIALTCAWGAALVAILADIHDIPPALAWGSLLFPAYYMTLSFYLHLSGGGFAAARSRREG
jgi:phosphatidylcholine synthase